MKNAATASRIATIRRLRPFSAKSIRGFRPVAAYSTNQRRARKRLAVEFCEETVICAIQLPKSLTLLTESVDSL